MSDSLRPRLHGIVSRAAQAGVSPQPRSERVRSAATRARRHAAAATDIFTLAGAAAASEGVARCLGQSAQSRPCHLVAQDRAGCTRTAALIARSLKTEAQQTISRLDKQVHSERRIRKTPQRRSTRSLFLADDRRGAAAAPNQADRPGPPRRARRRSDSGPAPRARRGDRAARHPHRTPDDRHRRHRTAFLAGSAQR